MRRKHVPQRTCIGCHEIHSKREMIRLVRTPEGQLTIDETGKKNGRGAYLCRQKACWESVLRGNQLSKALKIDIGEKEKDMVRAFAATLE
jgi:predicted RNA-binding protein YlxR (DUF448 family)